MGEREEDEVKQKEKKGDLPAKAAAAVADGSGATAAGTERGWSEKGVRGGEGEGESEGKKIGAQPCAGKQKPARRTAVPLRTATRARSVVSGLCARLDTRACVKPCDLTALDARPCVPVTRPCAPPRLCLLYTSDAADE